MGLLKSAYKNFTLPGRMGIGLTGSNNVSPTSLLTEDQKKQLGALSGYSIDNYKPMFSTLGSLAYNPESNYSRLNNWESEFNSGVVNPMTSKLNELIANTNHSSNLHSSANRFTQDKLRQDTLNNLSGLRYDQLMKERAMELQGLDNMKNNQMSALSALLNLSGQGLGVNGIENIVSKNNGLLDYAAAFAPAAAAL